VRFIELAMLTALLLTHSPCISTKLHTILSQCAALCMHVYGD